MITKIVNYDISESFVNKTKKIPPPSLTEAPLLYITIRGVSFTTPPRDVTTGEI